MKAEQPSLPNAEDLPPSSERQVAEQERTNANVAGASGILALGNIFSRVLGLARETMLTFLFGASGAVDAFQVAIIVPRAIYDLLIGGHINGAIVPVLSEIIVTRGKDELWRVVSILMSLVCAALALLVLLIEIFAPQIVMAVASGADAGTVGLATDMLRMTAPALICMSLFAVFSGTLFALRSFTLPAFAGVVFNACTVLVTLALVPSMALQPSLGGFASLNPFVLARPASGIMVVALGWLIGAIAQVALQLPGLQLRRLRLSIRWRHPALRSIATLYAPVMFSLVMDTLIIRPFSYNIANQTGAGGIAYMVWATTLIQFPQGLVATAISIAILPTLARQSSEMTEDGHRAFQDTLGLGLRLTMTLILPAATGLFVLAIPIIALLFEHGAFGAADTQVTAQALRLYLIGLPFAAVDLLLVYAFYARKDTLTPALVGVVSLVCYMGAALLLFDSFGLFSLMIADSLKHFVHASISGFLLWRRLDGFGSQRMAITVFKTAVASVIMAVAALATLPYLSAAFSAASIVHEALLVTVGALLYGGIFLSTARVLRLDELAWLWNLLRRRVEA
ncbi:MAG: murein biosynthesis integral membrane protein MurJ [Chloroflexi bacterium]|nr:murein biosynthesis integral membrane protein MurJ [Chloroflexota bacterium]